MTNHTYKFHDIHEFRFALYYTLEKSLQVFLCVCSTGIELRPSHLLGRLSTA
jgi:hypothetical protein